MMNVIFIQRGTWTRILLAYIRPWCTRRNRLPHNADQNLSRCLIIVVNNAYSGKRRRWRERSPSRISSHRSWRHRYADYTCCSETGMLNTTTHTNWLGVTVLGLHMPLQTCLGFWCLRVSILMAVHSRPVHAFERYVAARNRNLFLETDLGLWRRLCVHA